MSDDMSQYRDVFLSESAEYLQLMTDGLITLESNPDDLEPVEAVFRGAHSLKGMAAAMGYLVTQELTHKMESLMDTVRSKQQVADRTLIDLMLRATDVVRDVIASEATDGAAVDVEEVSVALLKRVERSSNAEPERSAASAASEESAEGEGSLYRVRVTLESGCVLKGVRAYMAIKRLSHMGVVVETIPGARELEDEQFERSFDIILRTKSTPAAIREAAMGVTEVEDAVAEEMEGHLPGPEVAAPSEKTESPKRVRAIPKLGETQTVRVSIGHLDTIVNLVGELVIVRSRLDRIAEDLDRPDLTDALGVLARVSGELQQEVMQTRMVPVGNIFNRFPRMVRDLARDLGKQIVLETSGLDIELDRTVLDEIGDPIVHLLRNSVDHGIEPAEERARAGKPGTGTITLHAERDRDQIRITVTDDGRGMDLDRIWEKAAERGLVDSRHRDAYSRKEILMLCCVPGFSTVDHATRVSGRGVGMDVVKGKIEYLGGTMDLNSEPGRGLEVTLVLPLTLAIIQALLVGQGSSVFAVPLGAVDEVLSPHEVRFATVEGSKVVVLRDGTPVALHRLGEIAAREGSPADADEHLVIMRSGDESNALAVESLIGRREIVIKPLSPLFRGSRGFSGATVLGDGRVALILDPRTLFSMEG